MDETAVQPAFEELLAYLRSSRGFDFTGYKRSSLTRRIRKRMGAVGIDDFAEYRGYVETNPDEVDDLFNAILINVTSFFRDREAWESLRDEVMPRILRHNPSGELRLWSAGCASGEEPFSLAMLLADALGLDEYSRRVKIYATDWDEDALQQARRASYTVDRLEPVPEAMRRRYFQLDGDRALLHPQLRRSVIFGRHDLVEDSPISRLDLLLCRNTLMYFNLATQTRILARLHFALKDHGLLFLGRAEMLLSHAAHFAPLNLKYRVFSKVPHHLGAPPPVAPPAQEMLGRDPELARHEQLREAALDAAPVAQIVCDGEARLALYNQRARAMFDLRAPDLGRPLHELELSYRPVDLRSMIDEARVTGATVHKESVERPRSDGTTMHLDIMVTPVFRDGELIAIAVSFDDVTRHHELQENLQRFSENLETAYEELQSSNEELETTNEELQSSNEELETTNEELQAANEEMETVNEELRSTNEELAATNDRLRQREEEVKRGNAFLRAILGSLRSGVAVVDRDLHVRVWNDQAAEMWGVRADEVLDSRLLDLDIGLPIGELDAPLRNALNTAARTELTLSAINRRGRRFECSVVINPFVDSETDEAALTILMDGGD